MPDEPWLREVQEIWESIGAPYPLPSGDDATLERERFSAEMLYDTFQEAFLTTANADSTALDRIELREDITPEDRKVLRDTFFEWMEYLGYADTDAFWDEWRDYLGYND